jgi:hypothetical protein
MALSESVPNPNHQQHEQPNDMVEHLGEDRAMLVVVNRGPQEGHHLAALAGSPAAISAIDSAGKHGGANIRPAPATTDDKPPDNHEDHPPRLKYEQVVACNSALAAGIGAVHRSANIRGHDLEAGGSQHRLVVRGHVDLDGMTRPHEAFERVAGSTAGTSRWCGGGLVSGP